MLEAQISQCDTMAEQDLENVEIPDDIVVKSDGKKETVWSIHNIKPLLKETGADGSTRILDPTLATEWRKFAEGLKCDTIQINTYQRNIFIGTLKEDDVIRDILEKWVGRMGSKAKLKYLVDTLQSIGSNNPAERIKLKYQEGLKLSEDKMDLC